LKKNVFCVTTGHEGIVADRFNEINSIIKKNATVSLKKVVKGIANVSMGAWYNYFSKGALRGKLSNVTAAALKTFFGLPEDVFIGKGEFTPEHRELIASKIKETFGSGPREARGRKPNKDTAVKVKAPKKAKTPKVAKPKKVKAVKVPKVKKVKAAKVPKVKKVKAAKIAKPKKVKAVKAPKAPKIAKIKAVKIAKPEKIKAKRGRKPGTVKALPVEGGLKSIAVQIDNIKDLKHLKNMSAILTKLSTIAQKKMELLEAMSAI